MSRMMPSLWSRFLDLVAPRSCAVCGCRLGISEQGVCSSCYLHLPRTTYQFSPYDNPMTQLFWGLAPAVSRAAALFFYEPHSEVARLVYDLKYRDRPDIGVDIGRMMAEEMRMAGFFDGVNMIVPVPLAPKRQRQRGYNQSERLAQGLHEVTGLPVNTKVLCRKGFRQSQTALQRHQRQENVADLFALRSTIDLAGKHLLLVDDVCTTGATLASCADALNVFPGLRISILTLGFTKS